MKSTVHTRKNGRAIYRHDINLSIWSVFINVFLYTLNIYTTPMNYLEDYKQIHKYSNIKKQTLNQNKKRKQSRAWASRR